MGSFVNMFAFPVYKVYGKEGKYTRTYIEIFLIYNLFYDQREMFLYGTITRIGYCRSANCACKNFYQRG